MENICGEHKDKVSIIVPKRRGENIDNVLESIRNSTYSNYEIIVVDEGLERSEQRNIGISRAKGEFLLILDSDQCIHKSLLIECVFAMRYADALYIPEKVMTKGLFGYIRNWERQFYNQTPIDCVRFVRAKDCPLFDTTMRGPEDSDWDRRIKGKRDITYFNIYHYDNVGIIKFLLKKAYYSKSMRRFAEKYPDDKCLNFWWRCFGVFLEQSKWKRFLSRPDLALAVLLLIFARGVVYYVNK